MARRKNVKRIDPRYFLNETVNRGEELEEANWADEPEADRPWSYKPSSAGGYSAQVDREKPAASKKGRGKMRPRPGESDEEFFQRQADAVNKRLGKLEEREGETAEDVAARLKSMPASMSAGTVNDFFNMMDGSTDMTGHYPHVEDHREFATQVLKLLGELPASFRYTGKV